MTPRKAGSEFKSARDEKAPEEQPSGTGGMAATKKTAPSENPSSASNTRADNPAPPPCEIEEEICSCHVDSHFHAANHHAEIAELRAAIFHVTTWLEKGQIMYSPNFFILEFQHLLHSRAALAPKEKA